MREQQFSASRLPAQIILKDYRMIPVRTWLSWSSGKDSAYTLHTLRRNPEYSVEALFTTINETHGRVAMHAVREELLERQAEAAGLPLHKIRIPHPCPNEIYEDKMREFTALAVANGIEAFAFGDLFLEDIRKYREEKLAPTAIKPVFPLWKIPTADLAAEMIACGMKAVITSVDPKQISSSLVGRDFDAQLLRELPAGADPCAENGEFHTFAWDGPMFRYPVNIRRGEIVEREGFFFADLLPADKT